jgi:phosphohistidine phosphatase
VIIDMILYLMRHGIAEDSSLLGSDADRKLTQRGTLRTAMVAKGLHRIGIRFDRIISSPYVRAKQTAEIMARITGYEGDIMFDDRLVPFARFEDVNDLIQENNDAESLLFTGHEPSMGLMISGLSADGQLSMEVKKASVTAVQIDRFRPRAAGSLLWSIPPKLFEAISK